MMVTILMAAYNGSRYIRKQLDSIIGQTYQDWELCIRDDQSTDETPDIINAYAKRDKRIKMVEQGDLHGSAVINFSALFDYAYIEDKKYIMFADQDDIWHPQKVSESLEFIKKEEEKWGREVPILVYSLFNFVDDRGNLINKNINIPFVLKPGILLTENHAYGCTMIFNRQLLQKAGAIPVTAENHDYWLALVACMFGKAVLNPKKLLDYRQHALNVSGNVDRSSTSARISRYVIHTNYLLPGLIVNFTMIRLFYKRYSPFFNTQQEKFISGYITAYGKSNTSLIFFMIRNGIRKLGAMKTLVYYCILIILRKRVVKSLTEV